MRLRSTMGSGGAGESRLAYVVDLLVQLRRDADSAEPELHRRDRALLSAGMRGLAPARLLRRWLEGLRAAGYWLPGVTVATVFRAQLLGLGLAGLAAGWLVTAALFRYDGSKPVNVVHVLVVLVGGQLLLLLLLGLVSVPGRISRLIPGLRIAQDLLGLVSPGQVTRWLARRLPESLKDAVPGMGKGWGTDPWPSRVLRWAAMVSAQSFGVSFNLGALAAALYLVIFSDLAFSWSTTLRPNIERGHWVTTRLSLPWRAWWPEAVPSRALIESTLYYRWRSDVEGRGTVGEAGLEGVMTSPRRDAGNGTSGVMEPEGWGGWWPFLVASVVVYGLVPRLVLLGLGCWRFQATLSGAFTGAHGVEEVLDRLTTEAISTQAVQAEEPEPNDAVAGGRLEQQVPAGEYWVLNYGGVEVGLEQVRQDFAGYRGVEPIGMEPAGGNSGIEGDAAMIEKIATRKGEPGVAVLVKSWEPPMLEVLDFLGELRRRLGKGRRLVVVLVGLGSEGKSGTPRAGDVTQWRRRLESLMDAELTVVPWGKEGV